MVVGDIHLHRLIKETHNSEEPGNVATPRETQRPSGLHQAIFGPGIGFGSK